MRPAGTAEFDLPGLALSLLKDYRRFMGKPTLEGAFKSRVLIVEDHLVVSQGLSVLIDHEGDLDVCGICEDKASALQKIQDLKPDLVLLDITLKGEGGLDFLKELKALHPKQKVLIFSMHDEAVYGPRAIQAGAAGYVMKLESPDVLFIAIRKVLNGGTFLSPNMEKKLMKRFFMAGAKHGTLDPLGCLTKRELEVFHLIGQANGTRQIAARLGLSPKTIETYRDHIKAKLNLQNGAELVRHAIETQEDISVFKVD